MYEYVRYDSPSDDGASAGKGFMPFLKQCSTYFPKAAVAFFSWLHHIFGWMKYHYWLSVSYKLISAIDGDAITNYGIPSLTARQTFNVFVLTHIALPSPDDTKQKIMYRLTLHEELTFRGQSLYMKKIAKA